MKIFGIGLAKTGTTSVSAALNILGIPSLHDHTFFHMREVSEIVRSISTPPFNTYDAFFDWPHPTQDDAFRRVAVGIPDCRFILTTRDRDAWMQSCLLHVLHTRVTGEEGWNNIDTSALAREWTLLHRLALSWREQNPGRLLIFDVKEGWEPLCEFLDRPMPDVPFPYDNRGVDRLEEIVAQYRKCQS